MHVVAEPADFSTPPADGTDRTAHPGATGEQVDVCGLREQKKRRTRDTMHRAALELAAEHGIAHVTVEMIAERAQVSPRTFFNYWDTKEAAVLGIVQGRAELAVGMLAERPEDEDPRLSLRIILVALARTVPTQPELRKLKRTAMQKDASLARLSMGSLADVQAGLVDAVEERLRRQDGDADARSRAVLDVQLAFAAARSAFAISMRRGSSPVDELERMHAFVDEGRAGV